MPKAKCRNDEDILGIHRHIRMPLRTQPYAQSHTDTQTHLEARGESIFFELDSFWKLNIYKKILL